MVRIHKHWFHLVILKKLAEIEPIMTCRFHSRNHLILAMLFFDVQDPCFQCHKSSFCVTKFKRFLRILDTSIIKSSLLFYAIKQLLFTFPWFLYFFDYKNIISNSANEFNGFWRQQECKKMHSILLYIISFVKYIASPRIIIANRIIKFKPITIGFIT